MVWRLEDDMNDYKKIEMSDDAAKLRMRNRRLETVPATDELKKLAEVLGAKPKVQMRSISEFEML